MGGAARAAKEGCCGSKRDAKVQGVTSRRMLIEVTGRRTTTSPKAQAAGTVVVFGLNAGPKTEPSMWATT